MTYGQEAYAVRQRLAASYGFDLPTWDALNPALQAGWESASGPWGQEKGPAPSNAFSGSTIRRDPADLIYKTSVKPAGEVYGKSPAQSALEITKAGIEGMQKRVFATGATRDTGAGKLDYEGFLSPLVLEAFARYMDFNTEMVDGSRRSSDNWQKGIPQDVYLKSAFRHFHDWWAWSRGDLKPSREPVTAICGLLFNAMGYLHEMLKKDESAVEQALRTARLHRDQARRGFTVGEEINLKSAGERCREADYVTDGEKIRSLWSTLTPGVREVWEETAKLRNFK